MEEVMTRYFGDLMDRVGGPMSGRLILQPTMAAFFAFRAGLKDARAGRPPYNWALLNDPAHRRDLLRDGWSDVWKVFVLAFALDTIYQVIRLRWIYPFEALFVAFVLAFLPYLLFRGPVDRIAHWWLRR
jgi:hypothetical protein